MGSVCKNISIIGSLEKTSIKNLIQNLKGKLLTAELPLIRGASPAGNLMQNIGLKYPNLHDAIIGKHVVQPEQFLPFPPKQFWKWRIFPSVVTFLVEENGPN